MIPQPAPAGTPPTPTSGPALRALAEAQLTLLPEVPASLAPEAARQVLHELRVHQIELEMQNEELRRTQAHEGSVVEDQAPDQIYPSGLIEIL